MDQTLVDLLKTASHDAKSKTRFRVVDWESGQIEIQTPSGPTQYTLKPLRELYAKEQGSPTVNPQDDRYQPLFLGIEMEIAAYYTMVPKLTDGLVQLTLERLSMDPAAACIQDDLCRRLQVQLQMQLSTNDYSRREVKIALGTIARSVERHKTTEGRRGYLEFIRGFFG